MKRETVWLLAYLTASVAVTFVHHLGVLCAALLVVMLIAGRRAPKIAGRAALAIVLFNSIVTVSYVILSSIRGDFAPRFVLLLNTRVFLLTSMTFLFIERGSPFRALSFSKTLTYLMSLAYSQILTFRRLYEDFCMALKSRRLRRVKPIDLYRHRAATASFFLEKSLNDATEISEAMTSRGFFND